MFDASKLKIVDEPLDQDGPRGGTRRTGPNPFLDKGWLEASRGTQGKAITVPAEEAKAVVNMIRTAMKKLDIGTVLQIVGPNDTRLREQDVRLFGELHDVNPEEWTDKERAHVDALHETRGFHLIEFLKGQRIKIRYLAKDKTPRPRKNKSEEPTPEA